MKAIFKTAVLLLLTNVAFLLEAEHSEASPSLAAEQTLLLDDDALMARLQKRIWGDNDNIYPGWTPWDLAIWFRKEAGNPSDERMHAALTAIYREAETREGKEARDLRVRAVLWLGVCSDDATKAFLLEVAAGTSKDGFLRTTAISSYLRNADAEEAKGALLRFLVGPDRIARDMDRSGVYPVANTAWEESSPEKKLAICEALQVGLAHESTHWVFCSGDRWLCGMSAKYARSEERLAMFERMYATPVPDGDLFDRQSLVPQIEMLRKLKKHTSVNSNLVTAIAHDFSQPLPEEERIALETPPNAPDATDAAQEKPAKTRCKGGYPLAAVAGLLAVTALWFVFRRKRGSA